MALVHCRVPGSIQVFVSASDTAYLSVEGNPLELMPPFWDGCGGGEGEVGGGRGGIGGGEVGGDAQEGAGAWVFDISINALTRRAPNLRSASLIDGALRRLQHGRRLLSRALYPQALQKLAAARQLLCSIRGWSTQGSSKDSESGLRKRDLSGLLKRGSSERERDLSAVSTDSESGDWEDTGVAGSGLGDRQLFVDELLGEQGVGVGRGQGSSTADSSEWLSQDVVERWGGGGGQESGASLEDGVGGGLDWQDRSSSTAGSVALKTRRTQHDDAKRLVCLNAAACLLRLELPAQAEHACTQVLNLDRSSAKALFRRGQARFAMGLLDFACEDLTHARLLQPHSRAILEELAKVERAQCRHTARSLPGLARNAGLARHARQMGKHDDDQSKGIVGG